MVSSETQGFLIMALEDSMAVLVDSMAVLVDSIVGSADSMVGSADSMVPSLVLLVALKASRAKNC